LIEESAPSRGVPAEVCKAWQASSQPVEELGVRRIIVRTGVVLSTHEGTLVRMVLPFKMFAGAHWEMASRDFPGFTSLMKWQLSAFYWKMNIRMAFLTYPRQSRSPTLILAVYWLKQMKRPYWLPIPSFPLRLVLGEMSTLVLEGQYLLPKRLQELGFRFSFETAEAALHDLLGHNDFPSA